MKRKFTHLNLFCGVIILSSTTLAGPGDLVRSAKKLSEEIANYSRSTKILKSNTYEVEKINGTPIG